MFGSKKHGHDDDFYDEEDEGFDYDDDDSGYHEEFAYDEDDDESSWDDEYEPPAQKPKPKPKPKPKRVSQANRNPRQQRPTGRGGSKSGNRRPSPSGNTGKSDSGVPKWLAVVGGVMSIVFLVVGIFVGYSLAPSGAPAQEKKQAATVKGQTSLLDNLESMKDAQIESLNAKIATLGNEAGSSTDASKGYVAMTKRSALDQKATDAMLARLFAVKNDADAAAVEAVRTDITKYFTTNAASTYAYEALNGVTPAKSLKANGRASAPSIMMPYLYDADRAIYVAVTPFTTEKVTVNVVSVVGLSGSGDAAGDTGRIFYYKYAGVITNAQTALFEKALAESTRANAAMGGDSNMDVGDSQSESPSASSSSGSSDGGGVVTDLGSLNGDGEKSGKNG